MEKLTEFVTMVDGWVWGIPLIALILLCGIWLTMRLRGLQLRHLGKALKFMVKNEESGEGEVTSFGALCTALSATIGTGNIVGVATAIAAGGPGALLWMEVAALFGMATKYSEGFWRSSIEPLIKTDIIWAARSITLKWYGLTLEVAGEAVCAVWHAGWSPGHWYYYSDQRNHFRSKQFL